MKLRLLPPRLDIDQPVIAEDPNFARQAAFIRAQSVSLSLKLLPLLRKRLDVNSVEWHKPQIELIKNDSGRWNFSSLGATSGDFIVQDGTLSVTDLGTKRKAAVYDHVDLSITNYATDSPFSIDARVHAANQSHEGLRFHGTIGPFSPNYTSNAQFDGEFTLKNFPIEGLQNIFDAKELGNPKGIASGTTTIRTDHGKLFADGTTKIDNASFNDVNVGFPITAQYSLRDDQATNVIEVSSATLQLQETKLVIAGSVDLNATPAQLDLKVSSTDGSVTELARLAATQGVGISPDTTVSGQMTSNLQIQGPVHAPTVQGTISARELRLTNKQAPQPVQIGAVDLTFTPTVIHSNPFDIRVGRTTAAVSFDLMQYTSKSPQISFTLNAPNASLADLRVIGRAAGFKGFDRASGSGTLGLQLDARGAVRSLRSTEVVRLLGGNATLNLSNVQFAGADLSKALFPGSSQRVSIDRVTGHFALNHGTAKTNDLRVALNVGNVAAIGLVDLANETLNLRATAVLNKAASNQILGSTSNHLLTAIGLNPGGELVVPGIIIGTFDDPKFKPDEEQMALSKMKGILPTSQNPAALLGSLLGGKNPKKELPGIPSNLNPANGIENVLGHVLGGRKR
jgi:hypothetical protein